MLFRIHGDPEHPFSEVVGVLQKIEPDSGSQGGVLQVVRRNGDVVAVPKEDLIKFRILGNA